MAEIMLWDYAMATLSTLNASCITCYINFHTALATTEQGCQKSKLRSIGYVWHSEKVITKMQFKNETK